MAQQDETTSLFGPTVAQLQQQKAMQDQAQMLQIAQLNPQQQRTFFGGVGGGMMGRGLADAGYAAGVPGFQEDPEVANANVTRQVIEDVRREGTDVNDPVKFYRQVSDKLSKAGKTEAAMRLSMKAAETEFMFGKRQAEIGKLDAEARAKLREKESGLATLQREFDQHIQSGDFGAAAQTEAQIQKINQPDTVESEEGTGETMLVDGKQVPTKRKVLLSKDGTKIWSGTPYPATGGQTVNLNNLPPTDNTGNTAMAAVWTDQAKKFNEGLTKANQVKPYIQDMAELIKNPRFISGSLPEIRTEIVRAMNTIGAGTPESLAQVSDSDLFDSYAINVILPRMAMLGGNDSNEELKKVSQSYANRKMDLAAIRRLVSAADRDIKRVETINQKYDEGLAQGRTPYTFNWADGSWRPVPGMPAFMSTPPGQRPQAANFPGTPGVDTPQRNTPPPVARAVGNSDIARYREVMTATGRDVSKYTDEQIKKVLERAR